MKVNELRERTSTELRELHAELTRKLWRARFDNFSNQLDDTSSIQKLRRDVARVNTILTQRAGREEPDAPAAAVQDEG